MPVPPTSVCVSEYLPLIAHNVPEVRFVQHGLKTIQVIDNGSGVAEDFHDNIGSSRPWALRPHLTFLLQHSSTTPLNSSLSPTSPLSAHSASAARLCPLFVRSPSPSLSSPPPNPRWARLSRWNRAEGCLNGPKWPDRSVPIPFLSFALLIVTKRGTTVTITNLFASLPVRRKELERNSKREFGKALSLLNAYALGPCCTVGTGVRLTVTNQMDKGCVLHHYHGSSFHTDEKSSQKNVQISTTGATSPRAAVSALWGTKALENIVDLEMSFNVDKEKTALKRVQAPL